MSIQKGFGRTLEAEDAEARAGMQNSADIDRPILLGPDTRSKVTISGHDNADQSRNAFQKRCPGKLGFVAIILFRKPSLAHRVGMHQGRHKAFRFGRAQQTHEPVSLPSNVSTGC